MNTPAMKHPAKFSASLITRLKELTAGWEGTILDPFAGVGGVHELATPQLRTVGIEIEAEWAAAHAQTLHGDSTGMSFTNASIDHIVTSPAYGNRMADQYLGSPKDREHVAAGGRIKRSTYVIELGRRLDDQNGAGMQWGDDYRTLHAMVWAECARVQRPGGIFVLNIKDHDRNSKWQPVTLWHVTTLTELGYRFVAAEHVATPGYRNGANTEKRHPEQLITMKRGS